jgi:hypothetical protein
MPRNCSSTIWSQIWSLVSISGIIHFLNKSFSRAYNYFAVSSSKMVFERKRWR